MKNNTTNVEETIDQAKESIECKGQKKGKDRESKDRQWKSRKWRGEGNESIANRTNEKDTQPLEKKIRWML